MLTDWNTAHSCKKKIPDHSQNISINNTGQVCLIFLQPKNMDCQLVLCVILHLVLFFAPRSEHLISLHRMTHHLLPPLVHIHHLMLNLVLQWQLSIMYQLHLLPTHDQGLLLQEIDLGARANDSRICENFTYLFIYIKISLTWATGILPLLKQTICLLSNTSPCSFYFSMFPPTDFFSMAGGEEY